jgi:hypothetical protein
MPPAVTPGVPRWPVSLIIGVLLAVGMPVPSLLPNP